MQAGRSQTKLTIQRASKSTQDGEVIDTWSTLATRWASEVTSGGSEVEQHAKLTGRSRVKFWVLWDSVTSTITTRDRVLVGTRRFEIQAVQNVAGKRREIELDCTEHVS